MPESSDRSDESRALPPNPTARPVPVVAAPAFEQEPWEIPAPPGIFKRWSRGWRLLLVLAVLGIGYLNWRGGRDYYYVKAWRARGIAADAAAASASGKPEEAAALLDKAAILAPLDPTVMRTIADFCEPRQDIMAIYALRQVIKSGESTPADVERLCRLALDWGRPELAVTESLKEWAATPPGSLSVLQLRLSALWLASRGQYQEGEQRFRQALASASGTPDAAQLEVALSRLLMNAASSAGMAEAAAAEPLRRLSGIAYSPSAPLPVRTEATRLLAGLLLHPDRRPLLTPVRADLLRNAFADLAQLAKKDPATASGYELAAVTVDLTANPEKRAAIISAVLTQALVSPIPQRLATAHWLNENQASREAIALCDRTPEQASDTAWFTVRMDSLFALKEYVTATQLLESPTQPLAPHIQQLFLYRIAVAAGKDATALATRRQELEKAASRAEPKGALSTAENLEKSGDTETALALYTSVKAHPHAGLTARLGMVRCLDADPTRTSDLIKALESVLQLWPQSDQARNDLAYLRLLDGKPGPDDLSLVAQLHRESPWYLSFRISAALAQLHQKNPAEALALLQSEPIPWDRVRPGWQAIYAGILTANGQTAEAQTIAARLDGTPLRPGEQKLFNSIRN